MASSKTELQLRCSNSNEKKVVLLNDERLEDISRRWSYAVAKRNRWRGCEDLVNEIEEKASADLKAIGFDDELLPAIDGSEMIEIGIPDVNRRWLSEVPWEFLLSRSASRKRAGKNLIVIRRLTHPQQRTAEKGELPLLFVKSAPGRLREQYQFETELRLVKRALHFRSNPYETLVRALDTPTIKCLKREIETTRPVILHLSGMDKIEGEKTLNMTQDSHLRLQACDADRPEPGFFLKNGNLDSKFLEQDEKCVDALQLAEACRLAELVSVNCFRSSLLAASMVDTGARFAIGFQDEVDNPLAEMFFAALYRELLGDGSLHPNRVLRNFVKALEFVRRLEKAEREDADGGFRGTGIVLWTREEVELNCGEELCLETEPDQPVSVPSKSEGGLARIMTCDIRPHDVLNYSILHNHQSLFRRFVVKTESEGEIYGLRLNVALDVAGIKCSYTRAFILRDFSLYLRRIGVPLTADLLRNLPENVYSSLYVRVDCQGQSVYEDTHRVLISPINEWKDDEESGAWLPSFVLPDDTAISKVTKMAQKYLAVLRDDPKAGFDGYQQNSRDRVHEQVRAVWYTLVNDFPLSYITPPPSFEKSSQRIRTPSQILTQGRGTCLDLSLLLAACLEYVGTDPVICLLSGHAFVGYFAGEEQHREFRKEFISLWPVEWAKRVVKPAYPWILDDEDARVRILEFVHKGDLILLEATYLTNGETFDGAVRQGQRNLGDPNRFESLFDVKRARDSHVVPLPIGGNQL